MSRDGNDSRLRTILFWVYGSEMEGIETQPIIPEVREVQEDFRCRRCGYLHLGKRSPRAPGVIEAFEVSPVM